MTRRLKVLWVLVTLMLVGAYVTHMTRSGRLTALWPAVPLHDFSQEVGFAYEAATYRPWLSSHEKPSTAIVFEDGRPLGPANAQHIDIRQQGGGRFSFWHDYVYLSASDNTDPRTNGRRYTFKYPPVSDASAGVFYGVTLLALALVSIVSIRRLGVHQIGVELVAMARAGLSVAGRGLDVVVGSIGPRALRGRAAIGVVVALWVATAALVTASDAVYLMRTGAWTRFWVEAPLTDIRPESGFAYQATTGRPDLSAHERPSPAGVLEDGKPLGLRNAQHAEIRQIGKGQYSFWYDSAYFSTTDNTDPRTNGRRYSIVYPPVGHAAAQVIYGTALLLCLLTVAVSAVAVRSGALGRYPADVARLLRTRYPEPLIALSVAGIIGIGVMRAIDTPETVIQERWEYVAAINVVAAWAIRVRYGRAVPRWVYGVFLAALCVSNCSVTVLAPFRSQGCHTRDPYPVWDAFCVVPDSASYYTPFTPGSVRQPLYSWFIGALTTGTGFEASKYLAQAKSGAIVTDTRDPLFRVARGQIVLLLLASAIACAAMMRLLSSPLPAVLFLWLYDSQMFTAGELNQILTEDLVQALVLLVVAVFFVFLWKPRVRHLYAAAILCGAAYLTRQASAYVAMVLGVMMLIEVASDTRRWWRPCAAAVVVFAGVCLIPDVYALAKLGSLSSHEAGLQYQYRIAHALQYAREEDAALMPDAESREWLLAAIKRRDVVHETVRRTYDTEYNRMVYYIDRNLYAVATPVDAPPAASKSPQFFMKVATPLLERHWPEYLRFAFRFWTFGVALPGLARVGSETVGAWPVYAVLGAMILFLRNRLALAGATLVGCHWAHVALSSMFAAPIQRFVWATEFLVYLGGFLVVWSVVENLAAMAVRQTPPATAFSATA